MSNDLVPVKVDGLFEGASESDLSAGSAASHATLSIKSSRFAVRYGEDSDTLKNQDGDPLPKIDIVVIDSQKGTAKSYYENSYGEGDSSSPTCFSHDGIKPDISVLDPVAPKCALCPNNQWGSYITPAGKKAKRCRDQLMLAVTFSSNIPNPEFGGAMLMRIPGASQDALRHFSAKMKAKGFLSQMYSMTVGFDHNASYPKLTYQAHRPLSNAEQTQVNKLFHSEQVRDILQGLQHSTQVRPTPSPVADEDTTFADPTEFAEEAPKASVTVLEQPKQAAPMDKPVAPAPAAPEKVSSGIADDLDGIITDMDGLDMS